MTISKASLSLVLLTAMGCSDSGNGSSEPDADVDDFDKAALLRNVAENVILPNYRSFSSRTSELVAATSAYCASLGAPEESANRTAAEVAWKGAMTAWQMSEPMHVGPALDADLALRELVYSWPITSPCAVDQEVMKLRSDPSGFQIAQSLTNRRGLDANEYALFATSLESECPPQVTPEGWEALSDVERRAARCEYLARAAVDLEEQASAIVQAWDSNGGNYVADLAMPLGPESGFDSEQDALNALFGALFYLDIVTKDQKLAEPTGLMPNSCSTQDSSCAEELESQYANHSKENISANLAGFEMLFFGDTESGAEGVGFDDYLLAKGRGDVVTAVRDSVDRAREAIEAMPGTAAEALQDDYDSVVGAHTAVKVITDSLKQDVPSILNLEIPTEAGGDND